MQITGETLRILRNIKGLKQEFVAQKMGITQPAYCKLEKAACIGDDKLIQLINAMNYTKEEFEKFIRIYCSQK